MASGPVRRRRRCSAWPTAKIEALLHKWFGRLPHPFAARDRRAGYRYRCSILQSEFSLTQALDQPVMGRVFFEQVIRENLDLGRPDQVQLIFGRRVSRRTPGRFRTRVITEGVTPSLHIDYKHRRITQYHKDGRHSGRRRRSTTRATSPSAKGCLISPRSGRSASRPTDVCSTSNGSATIARLAKRRSRACPAR